MLRCRINAAFLCQVERRIYAAERYAGTELSCAALDLSLALDPHLINNRVLNLPKCPATPDDGRRAERFLPRCLRGSCLDANPIRLRRARSRARARECQTVEAPARCR